MACFVIMACSQGLSVVLGLNYARDSMNTNNGMLFVSVVCFVCYC